MEWLMPTKYFYWKYFNTHLIGCLQNQEFSKIVPLRAASGQKKDNHRHWFFINLR